MLVILAVLSWLEERRRCWLLGEKDRSRTYHEIIYMLTSIHFKS
jgi:hypothetical protein